MISQLRLTNFRGFEGSHVIPLAPITLVYGPNSSGKSAVLAGLALLRQTLANESQQRPQAEPITYRGALVDSGDFRSTVHGHDLRRVMGIGITYESGRRGSAPETLDWTIRWDPAGRRSKLSRIEMGGGDAELGRFTLVPVDSQFRAEATPRLMQALEHQLRLELLRMDPELREAVEGLQPKLEAGRAAADVWRDASRLEELLREGILEELPLPDVTQTQRNALKKQVQSGRFDVEHLLPYPSREFRTDFPATRRKRRRDTAPDDAVAHWRDGVQRKSSTLRKVIRDIQYLGPLRSAPKRFDHESQVADDSVGPVGAGTPAVLGRNKEMLRRANEWLERMEVPYKIAIERISNARHPGLGELVVPQLTDLRTNTVVSPSDVGFGISQLLPVIVQCLLVERQTLLIEQPEIHLHPKLQAHVADLFIDAVENGRSQMIAETHSETLIMRLQKRIREGRITPDQVSVLYVGASEGTGSWVRPLPLDERGEFLEEWPDGFFEERWNEL